MIHITIILLLNVAMRKRRISLGSPGTEATCLIEPAPAYLAPPWGEARHAPAAPYNHAHGGQYDIGKRVHRTS
jgi:hypothetical protein